MSVFAGRYDGQIAVVTGGASGIGLEIARRLTAEGAKVSAWDICVDDLLTVSTDLAQTVAVDQSDEEQVARATEQTISQFGQIDVLVVSAGITGPNLSLADYPSDAWLKVMQVNVNGVFFVNRAVVP